MATPGVCVCGGSVAIFAQASDGARGGSLGLRGSAKMAAAAPTAAEGAATGGAGCTRTAWRRCQRRRTQGAMRAKLEELLARALRAEESRDALLAGAGAASGVREAALLAAHRLHRAACWRAREDIHSAHRAVQRAGWSTPALHARLLEGAVGRHHGLYTLDDEAFAGLSLGAMRRLQRAALQAAGPPTVPRSGAVLAPSAAATTGEALERAVDEVLALEAAPRAERDVAFAPVRALARLDYAGTDAGKVVLIQRTWRRASARLREARHRDASPPALGARRALHTGLGRGTCSSDLPPAPQPVPH